MFPKCSRGHSYATLKGGIFLPTTFCESKKKRVDVTADEAFYAIYFNKPNKRDDCEDFKHHYTISADDGDAYTTIKFCPFCGRKLED